MSECSASNVDRLEDALSSIESGAVYALAVELRDSGLSQIELLAVFDQVRARHQEDADARKHDAVLDVMDLIVGWCSPGKALYRRPPAAQ